VKLYEIRGELEEILARAIDLDTGEVLDEALCAELDAVQGKLEDKALDVAAFVVNIEADAEALKTRAKQLSERARIEQNRADSLKRYLASCLEPSAKLKDSRVAIGWRKSEACVLDVADVQTLPERWRRVSYSAATSEIKEALKAGDPEAAKVAHLETRQNLQVR